MSRICFLRDVGSVAIAVYTEPRIGDQIRGTWAIADTSALQHEQHEIFGLDLQFTQLFICKYNYPI
jgi:hypothetical protein